MICEFIIKHRWRTLQVLAFIITLFITINQTVQPMFSPRVSDTKITPLNIQGQINDTSPKDSRYYGIFRIDYTIQPPLFSLYKKIDLKLPGRTEGGFSKNSDIEFMSEYSISGAYYTILLENESYYLNIANLDFKLPLSIKTNGFHIREIPSTFYFREKIIPVHDATFRYASERWYSESKIDPSAFNDEFVTRPEFINVGYAIQKDKGISYKIEKIKIKSLSEFPIYKLIIPLYRPLEQELYVCDQDIDIQTNGNYIAIDLEPKEIKELLTARHETKMEKYGYTFEVETMSDADICSDLWREYNKLDLI